MQGLIICDDLDESALLRFVLQRAGIDVALAADVQGGLASLDGRPPDLVLLALRIGTPRTQVLCVRREVESAIALVSATADEDDLVLTYEAGADLVVPRPYSARLLGAQLRALLRRGRWGHAVHALASLCVGEILLDPSTRLANVGKHPPRRLTQLEFRLLHTLMSHPGQTVPTETILERVWGFEGAGGMELVRGLVRRLRAKIEVDPRRPRHIVTEPGVGYRLQVERD